MSMALTLMLLLPCFGDLPWTRLLFERLAEALEAKDLEF